MGTLRTRLRAARSAAVRARAGTVLVALLGTAATLWGLATGFRAPWLWAALGGLLLVGGSVGLGPAFELLWRGPAAVIEEQRLRRALEEQRRRRQQGEA